jgi:hypothetical protein
MHLTSVCDSKPDGSSELLEPNCKKPPSIQDKPLFHVFHGRLTNPEQYRPTTFWGLPSWNPDITLQAIFIGRFDSKIGKLWTRGGRLCKISWDFLCSIREASRQRLWFYPSSFPRWWESIRNRAESMAFLLSSTGF